MLYHPLPGHRRRVKPIFLFTLLTRCARPSFSRTASSGLVVSSGLSTEYDYASSDNSTQESFVSMFSDLDGDYKL